MNRDASLIRGLAGHSCRRASDTKQSAGARRVCGRLCRISRPQPRRAGRSRAAVDPVHRRIHDVRRGTGLGRERSGQVGARMQIQSVNLAVHGFSTDQAYLRLQEELPRFVNPWQWLQCSRQRSSGETSTTIGRILGQAWSGCPRSNTARSRRWPPACAVSQRCDSQNADSHDRETLAATMSWRVRMAPDL